MLEHAFFVALTGLQEKDFHCTKVIDDCMLRTSTLTELALALVELACLALDFWAGGVAELDSSDDTRCLDFCLAADFWAGGGGGVSELDSSDDSRCLNLSFIFS